jgi:hypothetical protein
MVKMWQYMKHAVFFEGRSSVITMLTCTFNPQRRVFAFWELRIQRLPGGRLGGLAQILVVPAGVYDASERDGARRLLLDVLAGALIVGNLWATLRHILVVLRRRSKMQVRHSLYAQECRCVCLPRCAAPPQSPTAGCSCSRQFHRQRPCTAVSSSALRAAATQLPIAECPAVSMQVAYACAA